VLALGELLDELEVVEHLNLARVKGDQLGIGAGLANYFQRLRPPR
jgi:hypothetical protein